MNENLIRAKIHQAVDAHGAALQEDPYLAQRIIAQTNRKEVPHMKKLSTGMIIAIVLMLLSVTAVAVGLTVEEIWQQSFEKMNTSGEIWNIGTPTEEDLTMEEAASIARKAIQDKFGVTDEELDAMGFYPTYIEAETDGGTYYPADWRFLWSSRRDVDLWEDSEDHGPLGEYRVYMDAITGEVDTCIFYTNNFWDYAQRVWDCGNYNEVYRRYKQTDFFNQTKEMQDYWTKMLADQGYEVRQENENLHQVLLSAELDLEFCTLDRIVISSPQVDAAWKALEQQIGIDTDILRKYAYVATVPGWNTGYDDVCIHYSYEREWDMMGKGFLDSYCDFLFTNANRMGLYMVSFEKGTTNVAAITHVPHSETIGGMNKVIELGLLTRDDWTPDDLLAFDAAYTKLEKAVQRMLAALVTPGDMRAVIFDYLYSLGGNPDYYTPAPAELNAQQWFEEESPLDAKIPDATYTYEEFTAQYGYDDRFWPQEVMMLLDPLNYRMPNEGEMAVGDALSRVLKQLQLEQGVTDLTGYTICWHRVSLTNDPNVVDCRWEFYITDDVNNPINGWKIHFGEWEDSVGDAFIQDITDMGNG